MRPSRLLLAALLLLAPRAFADEAPFGLRWGSSIEELQNRGIPGSVQEDDGQIRVFQTDRLKDAPDILDFARLGVDRQYGLQRIMWVSKEITDDPTGARGREQYQTIKHMLTEQYGDPKTSDEEVGGSHTYGQNSFYQCLAEDGCGVFVTVWRSYSTDARLRLLGTAAGRGRLEIVYLGPDWEDVVNAHKTKGKR